MSGENIGLVGGVVGIIGVVLTIYSIIKSNFKFQPIMYFKNFPEVRKISDENRQIKVLYKDNEVNQVTTTRFYFWNKGKRPLKKEDVPINDPLSIKLISENKDITILDFNLFKVTKDSCAIKAELGESSDQMVILFNYLDNKDGFILDVQHNGDYKTIAEIQGVFLGPKLSPKIKNYTFTKKPLGESNPNKIRRFLGNLLNIAILLICITAAQNLYTVIRKPNTNISLIPFRMVPQTLNSISDLLKSNGMENQNAENVAYIIYQRYLVDKYGSKIVELLPDLLVIAFSLFFVVYKLSGKLPKELRTDST